MAVAEAEAVAAEQPVSAQVVGNAFVQQYYHILHYSPGLVHRFYQDISTLGRPEEDGSLSITTTMQAINEKIIALNYGQFTPEVKSVDSQESFNGGVTVLVTGSLTGQDNIVKKFAQTFFLAPQDKGYFVLNDMLRYVDNGTVNSTLVSNGVVLPAPEPSVPAPLEDSHVTEQSTPSAEVEVIEAEVYNPPKNQDIPIAEEVHVAAVVDNVNVNTEPVVEANAKCSEMPKKSFASIVMRLKENGSSFSPPPPALKKATPKSLEQVTPTVLPTTDGPVSTLDSFDNEHNQNADGHSIYIKGLPMNATEALLEEVFKQFGTIKADGVQVRSNKAQVFCFGFVEFEDASSVQKAIEASPVPIGGRQAIIEEKRSTSSRGNNRGRFQSGRSSGFRSDGVRGRGNYGGNRGGYTKPDFNNRGDYGNNRGGYRGGSSNREGYQRLENGTSNGGARTNRAGGGMANGGAKNVTPRVAAATA